MTDEKKKENRRKAKLPDFKTLYFGRQMAMNENFGKLYGTARRTDDIPMHNIPPPRTESGRRLRDALREKYCPCLLSADYSQIELRILAELEKETKSK